MMRRLLLTVALVAVVSLGAACATEKPNTSAAATVSTTTVGNIARLDPRFDELVPVEAKLEKVADGFMWVEGPLWNRQEGYLLFSDIPNNAVMKWQEGKAASLFLKPSGYTGKEPFTGREPGSNGLAYDPQGRLVMCEHGDRRIARLALGGGYAQVDRAGLNSDRFLPGKRLHLNSLLTITPEFSLTVGVTQAVGNLPGNLPRTRLDLGFNYSLLQSLKRAGLF